MNIHEDVEYVLLTSEQIAKRVKELGKLLDEKYAGRAPLAVCILRGSSVFFADLIRETTLPLTTDFMRVSSYGSGTKSSGEIRVLADLSEDIKDREILLVEDIIDSGNTLFKLKKLLLERGAKEVFILTLLDKPARREADISADLVGFTIADEFVIGYGLDYAEKYRNLPYVGVLKRSVYEK